MSSSNAKMKKRAARKPEFSKELINGVAQTSWWRRTSIKRLCQKHEIDEVQLEKLRASSAYRKAVESLMLGQYSAEDFEKWVTKYPIEKMPAKFGERMGIDSEVVPDMIENVRRRHIAIAAGEAESPNIIENPQGKVDTSGVKDIGTGRESVYLYYFPTYRRCARLTEKTHWRCNIGKTKEQVITRVSNQIGDQLPEKAKIALILRTEDCQALETKIHQELKRRLLQLEDAVGTEWFLTSPSEVEEIYNTLIGESAG